MPIYDYRCQKCNSIYDILHLGKELIEDIKCPQCGSHRYIKLISIPGIVAKGNTPLPCDQGTCRMDKSCCDDRCSLSGIGG